MTEEINHSYDGGLYAELIQNRIFKNDPNNPVHWSVVQSDGASGSIALDNSNPVNETALTTSLRLDIESITSGQRVGIANDGYWGIPVLPNTQYRASFYAKATAGFHGPLTVDIESIDGRTIFAAAKISKVDTEWRHYAVYLKTGNVPPSDSNRFVISASSSGTIWVNLVSLFPPTYNNRPNGTRIDLMKLLAGMRPAFLRFPGGNYLEGNSIKERFEWKNTIGPLASRPGHQSPWGYRSTDGMGLLEFLEWCQDLHMQPLLAIYAGYSLNGEYIKPGADLEPYVQDALDEIEYVTGSTNTKWGKQRSLDGHPAPFQLNYVEIGNEDGFDRSSSYSDRFAQFFDAIKAKYPHLQLIATASVKNRTPDVIDDHYYRSAYAMEQDSGHYDKYNRKGPKIFVGEWASTEGSPTPTFNAALGDAAWLTGLERNSDLVIMEAYAPLLVNISPGGSQWGTNLIGYNALSSYGSPSYYVQAMFGQNHGDRNLPVQFTPSTDPAPAPPAPHGGIGVGTWSTQAEYKDIKVTSNGKVIYQSNFLNGTNGWRFNTPNWKAQDGVLQQTGDRINSRATTGDRNWSDYTYELKARKISGSEGFLILFNVQDNNSHLWWNV
jgi:alpha-N-arabinofuranosidase